MEIKMCTCPNGHYYNADIYSSCPECGAAAGNVGAGSIPATAPAFGNFDAPAYGGGEFPKTTSPNMGYGAGPIGVTEPISGPSFGGAQPIGKTMPANPSYGSGNPGVTMPVNGRDSSAAGVTPFSNPTVSAVDLNKGAPMTASSEPVVGWLVCVEGPVRGVDFRLHDGYNFIGREEGDIHIQGDNAISRQKHAVVAFYAKRNTFYVGPADGRNIIELNGEPVFNHTEMKSYDVLTIGNTKMMLVALCGDKFNWVDGAVNG
jgi:hypothetical protein